ncbi:unnamed protein product [Adineta ricciae]|uniref:Ubiquitin-like protease family profile domain-containing protein n=1 Tax=Adineta ricciae TaxID=249248 RepID=A0A816BCP8_ADIRI|nr:unnamed protein product [Adineta ricciae]CAF1607508.1 unnamed protein product [Adineta ricciae]
MILSSRQIVEAIIRMGPVNADVEPWVVMVVANILHSLMNKHKSRNKIGKTIVDQKFISEQLLHLVSAGVNIRIGKYNCMVDFFLAAIIPSLGFSGIDFQSNINISLQCRTCNKKSIISTEIWDYILVTTSTVHDILANILTEVFASAPHNTECPQCTHNDSQPVSLEIAKFPKHVFVRFHATTTQHSEHIVCTRSYCRYTLQSFVVFTGRDGEGHYYTLANRKNEWYKLDDDKITILPQRTIFDQQSDRPPAVLAHYTRPSNKDVFSIALWNVFTNFTRCSMTLPPNLSLNDAADYFAKHDSLNNNPMNFAILKQFNCSHCSPPDSSVKLAPRSTNLNFSSIVIWMVFVYETVDIVFPPFPMQKTTQHQTDLPPSVGPEDYIDEFVNDLLPIYEKGFLVGSIHIKLDDMTVLLSPNGDINDLIIDAHLFITASSTASNNKVLAVPSYLIRQIILKKLRTIPISWLNFDILLCPINQNNHWYIIIIDRKKNLILELDSSVKHDMPRLTNMKRILHILHLQHFLKTHKGIDFENNWKLITSENEPTMQQTDSHSCGIHLLLQAEAYVKNFKFLQMQGD